MSLEPHATADAPAWRVLLVDDEPAVHEVSRLILADVAFEGRKIELLSATSAAQAREVLARGDGVALVLLDVVMESDDAGIALVQHIRDELHDTDVQIVLRTGQPGMAPEREVILRYEINGYFLKTDITAQRLHSIVVSALRSYRHARSLRPASARPVPRTARPYMESSSNALGRELARARIDRAIQLQAQPEIVLASNAVAGFELVPHWKSSAGLLTAARVCRLLPDAATRRRVALWMLAQACAWSRSWCAALQVPLPVPVSIPIVGDSLDDCALLDEILNTVRAAALPDGTLDLLVTEATLLGDSPNVRAAVAALRALGVSFTLLDFGCQTISLPHLNRLAPDRLKIHRPFVRGVATDPERMALARSVIAISQTLQIVAIAEGIASDSDAQFFKWEGCDLGQGDALAPACAPGDVAECLQPGRRAAH
jgi:EAL domain-containing protein (putative c-di-GMP-specific phosphodiesterase class I)